MQSDAFLTPKLRHWAATADFQITTPTTDGRTLVWADGGADRYFVRAESDGWLAVDSSDRMGPEQFEWAASSPGLLERRFLAIFLSIVRKRRGLADIVVPGSAGLLAAGFSLGRATFRDCEYRSLNAGNDAAAMPLAVSVGGELLSTMRLVQLSVLAVNSVDAIVESYLNVAGKPLFATRQ